MKIRSKQDICTLRYASGGELHRDFHAPNKTEGAPRIQRKIIAKVLA